MDYCKGLHENFGGFASVSEIESHRRREGNLLRSAGFAAKADCLSTRIRSRISLIPASQWEKYVHFPLETFEHVSLVKSDR